MTRRSTRARFDVWCTMRADEIRRRLDDQMGAYQRRMMVWEHRHGWWAQCHLQEWA